LESVQAEKVLSFGKETNPFTTLFSRLIFLSMSRKLTTAQAIQKYALTYRHLLCSLARLDYQIHLLKKRLAKIAADEAKWLARRMFLTDYLQQLTELEAGLEAEGLPEKLYKAKKKQFGKHTAKARKQWFRNEIYLINLEKRKQKDNGVKLVLKEAKREQVQLRVEHTYATLQQLEYQQQAIEQELAAALKQSAMTQTTTEQAEIVAEACISNHVLFSPLVTASDGAVACANPTAGTALPHATYGPLRPASPRHRPDARAVSGARQGWRRSHLSASG